MRKCWLLPSIVPMILVLGSLLAAQQQAGLSAASVTVPRLVSFSGKVTDVQGKGIAGVAGVTFAIYGEQSGGAPLWIETQSVSAGANGNYLVQLGASKTGGLPLDLFNTGEARWLGVRVNGGEEQPRLLLLSVPYALKAADAETVGGLPPSAFVLAAAPTNGGASAMGSREAVAAPSAAPALSGTGTTDFIPLWTNSSGALGNSVLFQSGTGSTALVGINTATPASTLDVNGSATMRGTMSMAAIGPATASSGHRSEPLDMAASAFNSATGTAVAQTFQLQAEAAGNDTTAPSATLNLMFGEGTATPAETGLHIASNGKITFATGQTFPGAGTITGVTAGSGLMGGGTGGSVTVGLTNTCASGQVLQWNGSTWACAAVGTGTGGVAGVTAGTDLTGGGTSGIVTLNLDTTKVPQLSAANTFTANQTVNGNLSATGVVTGSSFQIGSSLFGFGSLSNGNAFLGFGGNSLTTGASNTGIGALALSHNTVGSDNTATGDDALESNTTGQYNTATGPPALALNAVGFYKTADGFAALISNGASGSGGGNNTAIGGYALSNNDTGSSNTAVGSAAMTSNTTGALNTAIGYSAGPFSGGLTNATAIGAWSSVNESNALILGGTGTYAVSVGIGTGTPYYDYALDVEA